MIGCSETLEEDPSESEESPFTAEEMIFFEQAMYIGNLVIRQEDFGRGAQGEPLWYAPNQEAPYTGWVKDVYEQELFQVMDGKKHGLYISWNNSSNHKIEKGSYQNGWKHGLWTFWYRFNEDGQKKSEGSYQNGWKAGSWIFWYEDGQKAAEGAYRPPLDGRIQMPGSLWGPEDANEYSGEHIRVGVWTFWYENGQKAAEGAYRDKGGQINIREGLWTFWYENGQKSAEGAYDGDFTALMIGWWPELLERQKESFDWYKAPKTFQVGVWITWYENGQKESQGEYEKGDKEGLWIFWYKNGQKESQGEYDSDEKVSGSWTFWDVNGQIIRNW